MHSKYDTMYSRIQLSTSTYMVNIMYVSDEQSEYSLDVFLGGRRRDFVCAKSPHTEQTIFIAS